MSEKEKATREYLKTLSKEQVIDLCLQYINDKNIAEQQLEALMLEISKQEVEQHDLPDYCTRTGTDCTNLGKIEELQRQLAEKDKEIERLKFFEKAYYYNQLQASEDTIKNLFRSSYQSPVAINVNQLAIQELEKVEELILKIDNNHTEIKTLKNGYSTLYVDRPTVIYIIDQQIKKLKGEKDE